MPRRDNGNQRDSEIMAGGAPIDCAQPFTPHMTANTTNMTEVVMAVMPEAKPSTPMIKLARVDTIRPVAINFLMLQ